MQLTISRTSLLQYVQRCQSIVEKRSTKPILCNLCLEADNQQLTIIGTDLQIALSATIQTHIIEPGKTTVSAQKLFEIIKELDVDQDIELQTEASFLVIKSGRSRFQLSIMDANEYPGMPNDDTEMGFDIDAEMLAKMIQSTAFAMSNDETRKYLTGTLFEVTPTSKFRMITTDSHRLALIESSLDTSSTDIQCIVPRKTVLEIKKIAEEQGGTIHLSMSKRQIRLKSGGYTLSSKIIDAIFPAYEEVIPTTNPRHVDVDNKGLDQVLRRAMIVANESTHDVRLTFEDKGLHVAAHNTDQEQAQEFIEAEMEGIETIIGFNGRYLRDVLGVISTAQVHINFKDALSPVLLTPAGDSTAKYVVMPMRI